MTRWRDRTLTTLVLALTATVLSVVPAGSVGAAPISAPAATPAAAKVSAPLAPRRRWKPPRGPVFNDPTGGPKRRVAIVARIRDAIKHTRRGDTIRISSYSMDRKDVADLLIKAHRRGVHVQMVFNDNTISNTQRRLQKVLGKRRDRPSFLVFCQGSCRNGPGGNLHTKIYSFSRSGASKNVIISSSANLTYGAAFAQWNDAYTIRDDRRLFRTWVRVFRQLVRDRKSTPRYIGYSSPDLSVSFQRELARASGGVTEVRAARAGSGDPVIQRLSKIGCQAPAGFGIDGRTVVKIIVYAWYGERGEKIARKVADLQRRGCRVKVIGSVLGESSARVLQNAGIAVKAADWDFGDRISTGSEDKIVYGPRCYSHYKFFTVSGAYDGAGVRAVWTGSENWSRVSLGNDEVTLRLNGRAVYRRYTDRFDAMWNDPDATHQVGVEPTRRPCAYR
ncbi:MAG TPA: phospholipase D-like domain-containing protein [Nocardioides sp.]|uniref:phospholipase D-like domain-containing protein n=1 Tax=Nocardioides sp. TaxID=35761 RepID=UPI002BECD8B3|nr:phospholipase D-like domain-containing protein [Nocardioides sp.]HTW16878.1 phospholipase D-like domain-containing protein [Nocardioides sp.]